jgi:hypothetical protein
MAIYFRQRLLLLATVLTVPFSAPAITTSGQYTVTILGRVQHNYSESAFNALCVNNNGAVAGFANVRFGNDRRHLADRQRARLFYLSKWSDV